MTDPLRDRLARGIAARLPRRVRYWVLVGEGVQHIRSDEVVPEVGFTEVLTRAGDALRS